MSVTSSQMSGNVPFNRKSVDETDFSTRQSDPAASLKFFQLAADHLPGRSQVSRHFLVRAVYFIMLGPVEQVLAEPNVHLAECNILDQHDQFADALAIAGENEMPEAL